MRILYIAGETTNWIVDLCNNMCEQGHDVTAVVVPIDFYDNENRVEPHKKLKILEAKDEIMQHPMKLTALLKEKKLYNLKYDIIFGSNPYVIPSLRYISEDKKKPWGVMLLDIPADLIEENPERKKLWEYWLTTLKTVDQVVFNTFVARDVYKNVVDVQWPDENVITYAVTVPDKYRMSGAEIKGDYVFSSCRLTPVKNINMITCAIAESGLPIKQIVVGRDRGDLDIITQVAERFRIPLTYKNIITEEEKHELIKNSLCIAYPQYTEYVGGLSPWEGMMIGKPTVCSDFKVLKDLFGDKITYFDRKKVVALSEVLTKIYKEDYDKDTLQKASDFAYYDACFENMAARLLNVFDKMVRK